MGLKGPDKGWAIGARYLGNWPYVGAISDVRIYDHALSAAEVRRFIKIEAIYESWSQLG